MTQERNDSACTHEQRRAEQLSNDTNQSEQKMCMIHFLLFPFVEMFWPENQKIISGLQLIRLM